MRGQGFRSSLAALAALAAVVAAVACGSSGYGTSPTASPAGAQNGTQSSGGGVADVTITINGMSGESFTPDPATVRNGQKVAWKNADSVSHTATSSSFDTGTIAPGETSAPITMSTSGKIDYACRFHPSMQGTLNVTDANSGTGY